MRTLCPYIGRTVNIQRSCYKYLPVRLRHLLSKCVGLTELVTKLPTRRAGDPHPKRTCIH